MNTVVRGIPIVQSRANGTAYGITDLIRKSDGTRRWETRIETVWADRVTPDSGVDALLARYRPEVEKLSKQVLAVLRDSLPSLREEYPLGNLTAEFRRSSGSSR